MSDASRSVTLFTGQWADLPFEDVARIAAELGYDGLEIAASGDHLDLERADSDASYVQSRRDILERYGLKVFAISNHLAGQAVCDSPIDFRHKAILRPYIWGDGDAEGVRLRAAEDMKRAARVARKLGVDTVVGFTGSSIWPYVAMFPPVPQDVIEKGYEDFAARWAPFSMSSKRRGCALRMRCTPVRSRTTTGPLFGRLTPSGEGSLSGSTGTPHT